MSTKKRGYDLEAHAANPPACSAASQLSQTFSHSESADLLCKSLLLHAWAGPWYYMYDLQ